MTTLNDYWPFLEALRNGKTLQTPVFSTGPVIWMDLKPDQWLYLFRYDPSMVRIKPELTEP